MSPRPKRLDPIQLGAALPRVLSELGLEGAALGVRVAACWEQVVGAEVARHTEVAGLRGPVLEVNVDSSAWSQHLQLRRQEILAGLAESLGEDAPTDLRLRLAAGPVR